MSWHPARPYNDLPLLPPHGDPASIETREVLKALPKAHAALAAVNEASKRISNPSLLLNNLTLLEAQASSEIENIVTTTDELFLFALEESAAGASPATKETYAYRAALYAGLESLENRNTSDCLTNQSSTSPARSSRKRQNTTIAY